MARPWFRMYSEFVSDPKVQLLAFEDQRHFVALLCLKCNDVLDSDAPSSNYRDRMLAKALGLSPDAALEAKRRLIEVGLIDDDWQPVKWSSRQYEHDVSTSRVRDWRAKKKEDETFQKQHRNVSGTTEIQNRTDTEQNRSDQNSVPQGGTSGSESIAKVFAHWQQTWNHPRASLDRKRREIIRRALTSYSEADLCQSISGYLNSPHHTGRNERATVYDDIGLFLRDANHIDAGLRFYAQPPETNLSAKTRQIIDQTEGWVPPELRNAVN